MIDIQAMIERNRAGKGVGLPCFCTANDHVLRAILSNASGTGFPTVIEATCNQVNQEGGYTGLTPTDFMAWVRGMARDACVPDDQLILGGDHLGPNPWRSMTVDQAMDKARVLVKQYVEAGFQKIHLDASMACGGEPNPSFEQIAERAADLCAIAEAHAPDPGRLIYVIGTEVPIPGGETEEPDALDVTSVPRFEDTISTHKDAFAARGLTSAWDRIVSVVTQPGVDFGHTSIYPFEPEKARDLSKAILGHPRLTFEAHSTDYQSTKALTDLVQNHFFFLKVGPELTFRFREAVWALADVESQLAFERPSRIREVIASQMTAHPEHWQDYYSGSAKDIARLRTYSFSDRIRYYWADAKVSAALQVMLKNLSAAPMPETLISQAFMGLEFGEFPQQPSDLLETHIQRCIGRYFVASGHSG